MGPRDLERAHVLGRDLRERRVARAACVSAVLGPARRSGPPAGTCNAGSAGRARERDREHRDPRRLLHGAILVRRAALRNPWLSCARCPSMMPWSVRPRDRSGVLQEGRRVVPRRARRGGGRGRGCARPRHGDRRCRSARAARRARDSPRDARRAHADPVDRDGVGRRRDGRERARRRCCAARPRAGSRRKRELPPARDLDDGAARARDLRDLARVHRRDREVARRSRAPRRCARR